MKTNRVTQSHDNNYPQFESEEQKIAFYQCGGKQCEDCRYACDPSVIIANDGCPLLKDKS